VLDLKANPTASAEGAESSRPSSTAAAGPVATALVQRGTLKGRRHYGWLAFRKWGRGAPVCRNERGPKRVRERRSGDPGGSARGCRPRRKRAMNSRWWIPRRGPARSPDTAPRKQPAKTRQGGGIAPARLDQLLKTREAGGEAPAAASHQGGTCKAPRKPSRARSSSSHRRGGREQVLQVPGVGRASPGSDVDPGPCLGRRAIIGVNVRARTTGARAGQGADGVRYPLLTPISLQCRGRREGGCLSGHAGRRKSAQKFLGNAEILEVFAISKVGKVAGCRVSEGGGAPRRPRCA